MTILEKLKPLGLLGLRLALSGIFFRSGYQKLFVATAETLVDLQGAGLPSYLAYIGGVLELFGGILLLVGLLTRLTALLLAIEMAFILARMNIPQSGLYAIEKYQLPLVLCAAAFALATLGAGLFSIDAATFERTSGTKTRSKG